ncbi:SBBP repeat-containing protein [Hymenobacter sp. BT770]|uniref:SBBP repeat-containing protein n=1 Tax=Hymenobacter sp. BT770 TaxID=2886942 RepID=UPI001D1213BC|nr:SBBP repeat-containing protein [Hymenobacter sp. BT770]MCC3155358.1 SBBP repeat-containing protein [Hymenobacter sp. BT770]MDO3417414.1 SBBP repeat-containing protein [Hymenobacter sp. BT770]
MPTLFTRLLLAASCSLMLLPASSAQQRPAPPSRPAAPLLGQPRLALTASTPAGGALGTTATSSLQGATGAQYVAQEWFQRYNGAVNNINSAKDLAVDGQGNVYVTGSSGGDYATLKYGPDGTLLWERRYNGPGNGEDAAQALAVDAQGNVYVTGNSDGPNRGYSRDYATLKYGPDGTLLWDRLYNGPANLIDEAKDLAVDGQGNVYVTGDSWGQYGTLKYGPDGTLLWERLHRGAGNRIDEVSALAVDAQGNVYVTGEGYTDPTKPYTTDVSCITLKYGPDGTLLWERGYNGPNRSWASGTDIAVDAAGNAYVTATAAGDYATLKYGPDGTLLWGQRYNGPNNSFDQARALAVDGQGNVYVTGDTGSEYATLKYGPDGTLLWERRYRGADNSRDVATALAVDGQGNVYVTGGSEGVYPNTLYKLDYATLKYGPDGTLLWEQRYNGPNTLNDVATALAVDAQGNVYVTGESTTYFTIGSTYRKSNYATLKYSQATPPVLAVGNLTAVAAVGQCAASLVFSPTATGTPAPAITYSLPSGPITSPYLFPVGVTTVTASATNSAGTDTKTFTVTVADTENPTLTAPAALTRSTDATTCAAAYTATASWLGAAVANDNCSGVVVSNDAPGSFPVGVTTVVWTATDAAGNQTTATQLVTIADQVAPVARTQPVSIDLVNGTATLLTSQVNYGSSDNCSSQLIYSLSQTTFTCANLGLNTVQLTVTDASGNHATAPAQVTVRGSVPTAPPIQVTPATSVYTGGVATTLYLGYGSQSATLTASGGGTYSWAGPTGLNSPTSATPVFTATQAGTFTYSVIATPASGCPALPVSVTLTVVEARCSSNGKKMDKVLVCHKGNLLCVSTTEAAVHVQHGDVLGACPASRQALATSSNQAVATGLLEAFPNPFTSATTLRFRTPQAGRVQVQVYNHLGQLVSTLYEGVAVADQVYERSLAGTGLASGLYTCRFTTPTGSISQRVLLIR